MSLVSAGAAAQLETIGWLHTVFSEQGIDYWLFGGWAVDFHAGRVMREHADIDVAIWATDSNLIRRLLEDEGWIHAPEPAEDGYTGFERGDTRLELAFLAADETGTVYTPLKEGQGDWPAGSFGNEQAAVAGVVARVVGLMALIEDKSGPRQDPAVAAKDRSDVAVLSALRGDG
jgi:hypothetical protein